MYRNKIFIYIYIYNMIFPSGTNNYKHTSRLFIGEKTHHIHRRIDNKTEPKKKMKRKNSRDERRAVKNRKLYSFSAICILSARRRNRLAHFKWTACEKSTNKHSLTKNGFSYFDNGATLTGRSLLFCVQTHTTDTAYNNVTTDPSSDSLFVR